MQLSDDQLDALTVALGEVIRAERKSHGWTRKTLRAAMFPDHVGNEQALDALLSLQTLATWELGTRKMTVARLVQVGGALDVPASDLLRRALERVAPAATAGALLLDRSGLARSVDQRLHPLQQWAAAQSQQPQAESGDADPLVVELPHEALGPLAALARITTSELIRALTDLVIERS